MNLINSIKIKNLRKKTAIGPKKEKNGIQAKQASKLNLTMSSKSISQPLSRAALHTKFSNEHESKKRMKRRSALDFRWPRMEELPRKQLVSRDNRLIFSGVPTRIRYLPGTWRDAREE